DGSGRRNIGLPGLSQYCVSAFQWHARKISSQPEKEANEVQYIMSGVASVVDSDGRRLTCGSGL
uniref:FBPase domain-containing protein n=1 Tax=Mesocestoides corti TaxID=53468 RepID=A0A5K3EHA1_MESCO